MAIIFPLTLPTSIGMASIELRATNAVAISQSPFTHATQVHQYPGQMWSASISVAPQLRQYVEPWVAFLLALKGPLGTFQLGDPNGQTPRGTATTASVALTANAGAETIRLTINGSLLAGDYIRLGVGSDATLHKVLQDVASGTRDVDIWPALRKQRTTATTCAVTNTYGIFRLTGPQQSWSINASSVYGLNLEAMEAIL